MNAPANLPAISPDTTRHDGWTRSRRRLFLESLAEGHAVESACAHVGMSKVSAYALRRRDPGFALAWSAASLRARDALADLLTSRAIDGQTETITREDGSVYTRHRYDNRLGLALLARLDRLAGQPDPSELGQPDEAAARGVAHDFDAFVDLIEGEGADPQEIEAFVEPRLRRLRHLWGRDRVAQWDEQAREAARPPVWYDYGFRRHATDLPPPADFDGTERGAWGAPGYARTLTAAEAAGVAGAEEGGFAEKRAEGELRRARWFGLSRRGAGSPSTCGPAPTPHDRKLR